jgi:hypothetical protein
MDANTYATENLDLDAIALEKEIVEERAEREVEKNAAIDMGEYDIGQEKGDLNWLNTDDALWAAQYEHAYKLDKCCDDAKYKRNCTLTPSKYYHEGECFPSKEKCQYCYKYWCGKCGNGISNYLVKCC